MGKKKQEEEEPLQDAYPYHAKSKEECFAHLGIKDTGTHHRTGLTSADAAQRLEQYGPNKLTEKEKVTLLQRIWNQVANVLVGILVFVACVSAVQAVRASIDDDSDGVVTNSIQVGLIVFVIT